MEVISDSFSSVKAFNVRELMTSARSLYLVIVQRRFQSSSARVSHQKWNSVHARGNITTSEVSRRHSQGLSESISQLFIDQGRARATLI